MRVMILVPILAPGAQLERAEPPNVHAGIAFFGFPQMREAVHKALHVERIEQANGAHPEKAHPAETENQATENGKKNDGCFGPAPDLVNAARKFRRPTLFVGGLGLVQPAQMRPPESALLRTGDVLRQVGDGVMQAVVCHPTRWMAGAVEHRPKDQKLLDERVGPERLVREHSVITNRRAESAESGEEKGQAEDFEARQRKKNQADDRKHVNDDEVSENAFLAMDGFPKRAVPGLRLRRLLRDAKFHEFSGDLRS